MNQSNTNFSKFQYKNAWFSKFVIWCRSSVKSCGFLLIKISTFNFISELCTFSSYFCSNWIFDKKLTIFTYSELNWLIFQVQFTVSPLLDFKCSKIFDFTVLLFHLFIFKMKFFQIIGHLCIVSDQEFENFSFWNWIRS